MRSALRPRIGIVQRHGSFECESCGHIAVFRPLAVSEESAANVTGTVARPPPALAEPRRRTDQASSRARIRQRVASRRSSPVRPQAAGTPVHLADWARRARAVDKFITPSSATVPFNFLLSFWILGRRQRQADFCSFKIVFATQEQRSGSPISYHMDSTSSLSLNSQDEPMTFVSLSLSGLTQRQFGRQYLRRRALADIAVATFAARYANVPA